MSKVVSSPNFLAPDAVLMMSVAIALDIGGVICFILTLTVLGAPVGLIISTILDIVGFFVFSAWTLIFRSGQIKGKSVKILIKFLKRVGIPTLIESIPLVGDVAFSWVGTVYLEVKNNG